MTEAGPCHWVEPDLCSACEATALKAFSAGFDKVCLNIARLAKAKGAVLLIFHEGKAVEVCAALDGGMEQDLPGLFRRAAERIEKGETVEQPVQTKERFTPAQPAPATLEQLAIALDVSVKLQAHYAKLLNQYDGGQRVVFASAADWIARLRYMGTIKEPK